MILSVITPELFADRGVAWAKAIFEVCNQVITSFGLLALAWIGIWQNIQAKSHLKEAADRLDRQGARIDANTQAIAAVALASPALVPAVTTEPPQPTTES